VAKPKQGNEKMMRPRELFGVGIRILAVWCWMQGAYWGYRAIVKSLSPGAGNPNVPMPEDVASFIFYVLIGAILMGGAGALIWLGYGDAPKTGAAPPAN
jgi:hypothetical protein